MLNEHTTVLFKLVHYLQDWFQNLPMRKVMISQSSIFSMNRDSLLKHSDLEESIAPSFRKTLTNFEADDGPTSHNKLHLVNGVIVPCLLHMMGILFFLEIPHAVGETGWLSTLLYSFLYVLRYRMFVVGESMALFTAMSLSALCTNGKMRAGGAYYMISRSLGPEFGGSMAVLFFTAYVVGSTFHISGTSLTLS